MLARDATKVIHNPDGTIIVTSERFWDEKYIGEIKYDGSRYIIQWDEDGKVFCTSRNASVKDGLPVDKTENLRGYLFDDCKELAGITIDGEVLVKINGEFVRENGSSEVNKIMLSAPDKAKLRLLNPDIELVYVAYDCLQYGVDYTEQALHYRKDVLKLAIKDIILHLNAKYVCKYILSETFPPSDEKLQEIFDSGHEGMMLKDIESKYEQNEHSKHWLKVKKMLTEDGIIMGGQRGGGKYKDTLGALIIGQFFEIWRITQSEWDGSYDEKMNGIKVGPVGNRVFNYDNKLRKGWDLIMYELKEVCTISGMDDETRHKFWEWFETSADLWFMMADVKWNILFRPENVRDSSIVEFIAQEKTQARYRHPRFLQIREDKPMVDCIFNN